MIDSITQQVTIIHSHTSIFSIAVQMYADLDTKITAAPDGSLNPILPFVLFVSDQIPKHN